VVLPLSHSPPPSSFRDTSKHKAREKAGSWIPNLAHAAAPNFVVVWSLEWADAAGGQEPSRTAVREHTHTHTHMHTHAHTHTHTHAYTHTHRHTHTCFVGL
jgi:hypothetical protein